MSYLLLPFAKQTLRMKVRFYESFPCNEFFPHSLQGKRLLLGMKGNAAVGKEALAAEVAQDSDNLHNERLKAAENDSGNSRNTR